jgi:hypothetical protein
MLTPLCAYMQRNVRILDLYLYYHSVHGWVGGVTQRANRMVQTDVFSKFKIKKLKNRKRKNKILKNSKYVIRYKYDYTDILFCFTPRILIRYVLS